ncbi:unnamed protein product [Lactuca saligna]|uniref:Uncharacterized protein n=1 Tax=Lactuca saligna TaxID=75948 RepID=A0AA36E738_LACSI|nr:unnamed protein product [Lactuca saligna]
MVDVVDLVCRADMNETHLKSFQGVVANKKEEFCDSKAERQVLSEQNSFVGCEKAIFEDHVATLEGQTEVLESQVRALTWEKGIVASELAKCQCQLARTHVNGVVARGCFAMDAGEGGGLRN